MVLLVCSANPNEILCSWVPQSLIWVIQNQLQVSLPWQRWALSLCPENFWATGYICLSYLFWIVIFTGSFRLHIFFDKYYQKTLISGCLNSPQSQRWEICWINFSDPFCIWPFPDCTSMKGDGFYVILTIEIWILLHTGVAFFGERSLGSQPALQ